MTPVRFIALIIASVFATIAFVGCATIYTPPGATTAQKLKDDLSAVGIVEADVKAQCGPQFAPLGATAMAILSIAEAAGDVAAYNVIGAVQAAAIAIPALAADAKGLVCVGKVISADYQKLKPKAAPPATTPPPAPAVSQAEDVGTQVMALLRQGATVTVEGSADAPTMSAFTP